MPDDSRQSVEARLRAAVESAPSGLIMVDRDGRIVLVNQQIERQFGYPREELLGQTVDVLVPDRFRAPHAGYRADFLSSPSVRAMGAGRDLYGRRKDGSEFPVEIGLTPVATEDGMFVLSSVVDISARKRAEARFRAAVESSPNGMVMVDADGLVVLVNREVERLFGYERDELLGQPIEMLVPERFRKGHPEFRLHYLKKPGVRAMGEGRELFGLCKDGSEVPVEIGLNPIETDDGVFVLSSIVDISYRVAADEEKRHLEELLLQSQKMEALGTLAGGVAHDFNNVLAGILSHAELLQDSLGDDGPLAELDELIGFANRGKDVVDRILAFSRRRETRRQPVAVDRIIREVTRMLGSSVPPNIRINTHVDPDLPAILADSSSIHQMLVNLGTNAAYAMPEGGTVEFGAEKVYVVDSVARAHPQLSEGHHAVIFVRDSGIGMDADTQARALEPFFTTREGKQGTGLGLAIVHRIVQDNGGGLELESAPGQGTTVRCFLPLVAERPVVEAARSGVAGRGGGQRILLIDDDPALAEAGRLRLERLGYKPQVTSSVSQAIEWMQADSGRFDAVITDYLMPEMNGLDLSRELTRLKPGIPILMFTGYIEDFDDDLVRETGVRKLLQKPAALKQLDEALCEILGKAAGDGSSEGGH